MDETNHPIQQFFTDPNGVNYSRYGNNSTWIQISPNRNCAPHAWAHFPPPSAVPGAGVPFSFPSNPPQASNPEARLPLATRHDPASVPLPEDDDDDFPPPNQLLPRIARPAQKVGGACHADPDPKGKGKQVVREGKHKASSRAHDVNVNGKRQKGCAVGAANYTSEDIWGLLSILSEKLPISGKAWNLCADEFNIWAEENERPVRTSKSLEAKFKQLVKTKKPTGDGEMPDYIQQAHEIEDAINEHAGTKDLDDEDIADDVEEVSSDEEEDEKDEPPPKKMRVKKESAEETTTFTARRMTSDRLTQPPSGRSARGSNSALLNNISLALDPSSQAECSEERAARTFQTGQIFSLTSQLRESQNLVESLRTRLADAEHERQAAERRADRAEMMVMFAGGGHSAPAQPWSTGVPAPPPSLPRRQTATPKPCRWVDFPAPNRTPTRGYLQDVYYAGGGHCQRWVDPLDPEGCPPQPESPSTGTRFYGRFTPESQRHSACTHRCYSPTAPRQPSPSPLSCHRLSPVVYHRTPSPVPHRHRSLTPPPIASSSRHPDCIPKAMAHDN